MKAKISSFLIALIVTFPVIAQNSAFQFKIAKKAHAAFLLDDNNKAKLTEAQQAIDLAMQDQGLTNEAKFWLLRGSIYNDIADQRSTIRSLGTGNLNELPNVLYPALDALEAFSKAKSLARKKHESKEAIAGIKVAQNNLSYEGVYAYELKDYEGAYKQLAKVMEVHPVLKAAGESSILDGEGSFENQQYMTGLAALNAGMTAEAKQQFDDLYRKKYDSTLIYEALYTIAASKDEPDYEAAYKYLEQGRSLYPDDLGLLFVEINHFLRVGQLDILISKLELAIEKEPENISLYQTLGSVYDQLYQREAEGGGDPDLVGMYFNSALNYYKTGLSKDPGNVDSNYSIGALYYNKAALETKVLIALSDDFSAEGIEKHKKKETEIMSIFDQALPYFQKAESLDPNEISTLIALSEIYTRKNDIVKAKIFKDRREIVQNGGKNTSSYFNN